MPFGRLSTGPVPDVPFHPVPTPGQGIFRGQGNTTDDDSLLSCASHTAATAGGAVVVMWIFYVMPTGWWLIGTFWLWNKFNGGKEIRKLNLLTSG